MQLSEQDIGAPRRVRRLIITLCAIVALVASGATWAVANSTADGNAADRGRTKTIAPMITGQATNGGCRMGYDTETSTNVPPDDTTTDNLPAATVQITKQCAGAVLATFSSEVSGPNAGDFIHLDFRATCLGAGGQTSPCTTGQVVFASPGHTFFSNGANSFGVRSVTEVFTGLKKGMWKFEVLPGGNNSANLQFRTFNVQAFAGG